MEQRGSVSQIKKLAANLKREFKTTLSMDNLCPQDPPCAGVRACESRPVRKRSNCIAHLRLFAHHHPHRCGAGAIAPMPVHVCQASSGGSDRRFVSCSGSVACEDRDGACPFGGSSTSNRTRRPVAAVSATGPSRDIAPRGVTLRNLFRADCFIPR